MSSRRAFRLSRLLIATALIGLSLALLAVRSPHASAASYTLVAATMILVELAALGAAELAVRPPDDRARRGLIVGVAITAGVMLFISSERSLGQWLSAIGVLIASLTHAGTEPARKWRWIPVSLAVVFAVWFVLLVAGEWHMRILWLLPIAILAALSLSFSGTFPGLFGPGPRHSRMALATLGVSCSVAVVVLAWSSPGAAIFIAIEGIFALVLAPRALRRFGTTGFSGLLAAAAAIVLAAFAVVG